VSWLSIDEIQARDGYVVFSSPRTEKIGTKWGEGEWRRGEEIGDVAVLVVGETDIGEWERQLALGGRSLSPTAIERNPGWHFYRVVAE
jgi:hypothetical protein